MNGKNIIIFDVSKIVGLIKNLKLEENNTKYSPLRDNDLSGYVNNNINSTDL